MKKKTVQYIITLKLPPGVSKRRMQAFIKEAVETWSGQWAPDDPIFDFHKCKVETVPDTAIITIEPFI
ncbi:MAG: hypothetical protein ACYC1K_03425 [Minisyncoccota bacterium]